MILMIESTQRRRELVMELAEAVRRDDSKLAKRLIKRLGSLDLSKAETIARLEVAKAYEASGQEPPKEARAWLTGKLTMENL